MHLSRLLPVSLQKGFLVGLTVFFNHGFLGEFLHQGGWVAVVESRAGTEVDVWGGGVLFFSSSQLAVKKRKG